MKNLSLILSFLALSMLSGCALFTDQIQKSADLLGEGFAEYCLNVPDSERPDFKRQVEAACDKAAGGSGCEILLTCPGDT